MVQRFCHTTARVMRLPTRMPRTPRKALLNERLVYVEMLKNLSLKLVLSDFSAAHINFP